MKELDTNRFSTSYWTQTAQKSVTALQNASQILVSMLNPFYLVCTFSKLINFIIWLIVTFSEQYYLLANSMIACMENMQTKPL